MKLLKQSAVVTLLVGKLVDKDDASTGETGLTKGGVDQIGVYKAGATTLTDISATTTFTHRSRGKYTLTLSADDTDTLGPLKLIIEDDDVCLPYSEDFMVVPANIYDSLVASDKLQVDVTQWLGNAAAAGVGNRPSVDATGMAGSTTAALNLKEGALANVPGEVNDAGATSTVFITNLSETTDDHYNNQIIKFTSGALAGQAREITDYSGGTKTITVSPALTDAPADEDTFMIF
jgi:hypothetical protein